MLIIIGIVIGLSATSAAVYYENQKCFGQCMESTTCNLQYQKCNSKCNTSIAEGVMENFPDNYWLNAERLDSANLDLMKKNHDQFTEIPLKTEQQENKNRTKYIIKANRKRSIEDEWSTLDDLLFGLTFSEDLDDGLIPGGASRSKRHSSPFKEIASRVMSLICASLKSGSYFDPHGQGHGHGHPMNHIDAGRRPQMVEGEAGDHMNYALFSNRPRNPQEQQMLSLELCCKPC